MKLFSGLLSPAPFLEMMIDWLLILEYIYLPENHIVKDVRNCETRGVHVDAISNISSVLKTREVTEYVVSPRDVSVSDPFQMYHAARSLEKTDFMRQLIEMKQNGFLSSPLGGAPVEVPVSKYFF